MAALLMKRASALFLLASAAASQGSAAGMPRERRGINLPPVVQGDSRSDCLRIDASWLKRAGFDHARVLLDPNWVFEGQEEDRKNGANLGMLTSFLESAKSSGMTIILAMSPDKEARGKIESNPADLIKLIKRFWGVLLGALSSSLQSTVIVEIYNEPSDRIPDWRMIEAESAEWIGSILPDARLLLGFPPANSFGRTLRRASSTDPNVAYSIHYYSPYCLTHAGLRWAAGVPECGPGTDAASRSAQFAADMRMLAAVARRTGVRFHVTEFGISTAIGEEQRLAWLNSLTTAMATNDVPWTLWGMDPSFAATENASCQDYLNCRDRSCFVASRYQEALGLQRR